MHRTILTSLAGPAQPPIDAPGARAFAGVTPSTGDFVQAALAGDAFEIEASRLALERGDDSIRDLAEEMIASHTQTSEDLARLAEDGGLAVEPAVSPTADQQSRLEELRELRGAEFVAQYLEYQEGAHEDAIDLFSRYAGEGESDALKAWAAQTLATLEHHLEMVRNSSR